MEATAIRSARMAIRGTAVGVMLGMGGLILIAACSSDTGEELATTDGIVTSMSPASDRALGEPDASTTTLGSASSGAGTSTSTTAADSVDRDDSTTGAPTSSAAIDPASAPTTVESASTTGEAQPSTTSTTVAATSTTRANSTTTTRASSTTTTTRANSTTTTTEANPTTTTAPPARPDRLDLPSAVGAIEGVATDRSTGRVFVGDLNNGNVWVGTVSTDAFLLFSNAGAVGRTNALGLATDEARRRLYVVSQRDGRVDVINLDSGSHLASIPMPGASSLNDVTVAPDGTAYVSDLGRPVVYRIAAGTSTGELWVDYSGTAAVNTGAVSQHGNGLVADNNTVLLAYMVGGELLRFDRANGSVSRVTITGSSTAGRDGLALCGNRLYGADISLITGGADRVWATDLSADRTAGTSSGSITSSDFSSISTIAPIGGGLIVANAQFGVSPKTLPFWLTIVDAAC